MKVSIIIPAYNEEKLLPRCLSSIFTANPPKDYEVIVVNNASTDQTEKIARSFAGVRVVSEPNKGLTRARQAGFAASTGDLLVYFDADTIVPGHWFKVALEKFKKNPKLVGVSGPYHYEAISRWARALEWIYNCVVMQAGEFIWKYLLRQGGIMLVGGNFAVKREALEAIGGFDVGVDFFGEDTNLTRRVARVGQIDFTNNLYVYTSPRRFKQEGGAKLATKYVLNFFGEWIFKRPVNKVHEDIR